MKEGLTNQLKQLKEEVNCQQNFRCLNESLKNHCTAKYYALADMMECLDKKPIICNYTVSFAKSNVCRCPLRKFIATNFEHLNKTNI